ncbi:MAG TPA: hypothetical protein VKU00_34860 [Chthonomonadaceae bacterium]|nr:hypothetical protein [Chthonomonadaceae bacterium]
MANGTIYELKPGCRYRVRKDFTDFYKGHFAAGTILTFQHRNYLPYHGGNTIQFAEKTLSLQDDENADILDNLWDYLEEVR